MGLSTFNVKNELQEITTTCVLNSNFERLHQACNQGDTLPEITQTFLTQLTNCHLQDLQQSTQELERQALNRQVVEDQSLQQQLARELQANQDKKRRWNAEIISAENELITISSQLPELESHRISLERKISDHLSNHHHHAHEHHHVHIHHHHEDEYEHYYEDVYLEDLNRQLNCQSNDIRALQDRRTTLHRIIELNQINIRAIPAQDESIKQQQNLLIMRSQAHSLPDRLSSTNYTKLTTAIANKEKSLAELKKHHEQQAQQLYYPLLLKMVEEHITQIQGDENQKQQLLQLALVNRVGLKIKKQQGLKQGIEDQFKQCSDRENHLLSNLQQLNQELSQHEAQKAQLIPILDSRKLSIERGLMRLASSSSVTAAFVGITVFCVFVLATPPVVLLALSPVVILGTLASAIFLIMAVVKGIQYHHVKTEVKAEENIISAKQSAINKEEHERYLNNRKQEELRERHLDCEEKLKELDKAWHRVSYVNNPQQFFAVNGDYRYASAPVTEEEDVTYSP